MADLQVAGDHLHKRHPGNNASLYVPPWCLSDVGAVHASHGHLIAIMRLSIKHNQSRHGCMVGVGNVCPAIRCIQAEVVSCAIN